VEPILSSFVEAAAKIASSGRWEALNAKIEHLARNPGKGKAWWVQVFACLWFQLSSEYVLLKRDFQSRQGKNPALLAWRARNLLELSVWCVYCAKSADNAYRLYVDAGRDATDIYDAFAKWGNENAMDPSWLDPLAAAERDIAQGALACGIGSLKGRYKNVREAAGECGLGGTFRPAYLTLSKFAHPTAMQILAPSADATKNAQRDFFFSQGCLFFVGAFEALEAAL
jgi:hypothetical protein